MEIGNRRRKVNLQRVAAIRRAARREGLELLDDPFWAAGVVAYWAEGAKRANKVVFSNSDPQLVSLFIRWSRCYLNIPINGFAIDLHLHGGQDPVVATCNWSELIGISLVDFRRSYIKPEGSGHRKNVLYNGTAQITVRKSTDHFHRIMGWIDAVQTLSEPVMGALGR